MMNRLVLLIVAIVLIAAGCSAPAELSVIEHTSETGNEVGRLAPDFVLESFEGEQVRLSDFRGKVVFLDFWAAWCPFCVQEIPEIESFHKAYGEDLVVLGIHRTDTESESRGQEFADELGVTYTLLKDVKNEVHSFFTNGRPLMPVAIFVTEEGIISTRLFGPKSVDQMREALKQAQQ